MRRILTPAIAATLLAVGAYGAWAQSGETPPPPAPGGAPAAQMDCPMMGDGPKGHHGMMGGKPGMERMHGMHARMMGDDHGPRHGRMGPPPMMMKMMFAIADADGSGEVSLAEMQEIQARIFTAMDADKSGGLTQEELKTFMHPGKPGDMMGKGMMGKGMMGKDAPAADAPKE